MNKYNRCFLIIPILLLSLSLFSGCLGSPEFQIIFENRTQEVLTIYIDDYEVGEVDPGDYISHNHVSWNYGRYLIEAINSQQEIVFSKTLTRETMEKIETMVYKVIITSSENNTGTQPSGNFTPKE